MKGVKRIILGCVALLWYIATGTSSALSYSGLQHFTPTITAENGSCIQQVETPLERTMKVIYLNGKADLSQTVGQGETQQGNNGRVYLTSEADCPATSGTATAQITSNSHHQQYTPHMGTDYYVYALRKILR